MPDNDPSAGTPPASVPTVEQVLQERGIDGAKLAGILDSYAEDVKSLKGKAKMTAEERTELENLRKQRQEAEAATLTEVEKANRAAEAAEARAVKVENDYKAVQRKLTLERHLTQQLKGLPDPVAELYAEHVRATVPGAEWDTDEDLQPIMQKQLERWSKLSPVESGGDGVPFGVPGAVGQPGSQHVQPTQPGPVSDSGGTVPFMARFFNRGAGK